MSLQQLPEICCLIYLNAAIHVNRNLQTQTLPYLRLSDKVYQALELMNENHVEHLPIVDGDKYLGMISEDDFSQAENDHSTLEQFKQSISNPFVKGR